MTRNRANFLSWLFILAAVAVAAWLYPEMPDPVPVHWNIHGEADGFMAKPWGVIMLPGIPLFLFVIMRLIPVIAPKRYRTGPSGGVLNILQVVLVGFGSLIAILALLQAYGLDVHLNQSFPPRADKAPAFSAFAPSMALADKCSCFICIRAIHGARRAPAKGAPRGYVIQAVRRVSVSSSRSGMSCR